MRRPPSKPPSKDEPIVTLETQPDAVPSGRSDLGLSKAQLDEVVKAMLVVVRRVGCPVHMDPLDVVHDAFVVALLKPISERPSSTDWKRFVAWMCTLAGFAALTNRKSKHQQLLGAGHSEEYIGALLSVAGFAEAIDARHDVHKVFTVLKPADQELLKALFVDEKTTQDMALELKLPWSTVKSRTLQALDVLYAALQALIAALVLFFPKNARAQSARLVQHVSRLLPQATPGACAVMVTVVCGVMVPSASIGTVESQGAMAVVFSAPPSATVATAMAPMEPAASTEVEPVKPIPIDELEKQWSAADMKATTIVSYLQATMFPFAFLVMPAVTQVACAGAEHHAPAPPPPQEPEEEDEGGPDIYEQYCGSQRRLGADCPSRVDWCASMGMRPAPKGCK